MIVFDLGMYFDKQSIQNSLLVKLVSDTMYLKHTLENVI